MRHELPTRIRGAKGLQWPGVDVAPAGQEARALRAVFGLRLCGARDPLGPPLMSYGQAERLSKRAGWVISPHTGRMLYPLKREQVAW